MAMPTWLVEVQGSPDDFERLAPISSPPDWSITEEDGQYYLASSDFDDLTGAADVRLHAESWLLPVINGAAWLKFGRGRTQPLELGVGVTSLDESGSRGEVRHVFANAVSYVGAEDHASASGEGANDMSAPAQQTITAICTALRHDSRFVDALVFFSAQDYWAFHLYKVFEIIQEDAGGKDQLVKRGWATHDQLDGFRAVHNPALIGLAARHGVETKTSRRRPTNPMLTESGARPFVHALLEHWLRWKYQTTFLQNQD
jgi:hypothetical protein